MTADTQSATLTDSERMKLIKWAKKNGATSIKIDGIEIEFVTPGHEINVPPDWNRNVPLVSTAQTERDFSDELMKKYGIPGEKPSYVDDKLNPTPGQEERMAAWHADKTWPHTGSDSTHKAMAAIRSKLEDPEIFAQESDAWANQTRLPR